jgi:hypothetical protein
LSRVAPAYTTRWADCIAESPMAERLQIWTSDSRQMLFAKS